MAQRLTLHADRLFPADPGLRDIARRIFASARDLPILSPHGHTDPAWFATNSAWQDATSLLLVPDHYLYRMLYSQGVPLESLGIPGIDGRGNGTDPQGCLATVRRALSTCSAARRPRCGSTRCSPMSSASSTACRRRPRTTYYEHIGACLQRPEFRPRALFERFNIEVLTTTESPLDQLPHHDALLRSGWKGRVLTAYRPDPVVDPEFPGFRDGIGELASLTGEDTRDVGRLSRGSPAPQGFLQAHGRDVDRPRPSHARAPPTSRRAKPRPCSGACSTSACRRRMPNSSARRC